MSEPRYKTLNELLVGIKKGEVEESDIRVVMDNDNTCVEIGHWTKGYDEFDDDNLLYCGNGYVDVEDLWPLVLPKAVVEWC